MSAKEAFRDLVLFDDVERRKNAAELIAKSMLEELQSGQRGEYFTEFMHAMLGTDYLARASAWTIWEFGIASQIDSFTTCRVLGMLLVKKPDDVEVRTALQTCLESDPLFDTLDL